MRKMYDDLSIKRTLALAGVLTLGGLSLSCGEDDPKTAASNTGTTASQPNKALKDKIQKASTDHQGKTDVPAEFCNYSEDNPQPLYNVDPPQVAANGLCQVPPSAPQSLFDKPVYSKEHTVPGVEIANGEVLDVDCYTQGEEITNNLGPRSASDVWLKVIYEEDTVGYISTVNAGYPDLSQFEPCK